jgi:hypothetical protein
VRQPPVHHQFIITNSILFDELIFYSSSALKNLLVLEERCAAASCYQEKVMHLVPFQAIYLGVTWHLHNLGVDGC